MTLPSPGTLMTELLGTAEPNDAAEDMSNHVTVVAADAEPTTAATAISMLAKLRSVRETIRIVLSFPRQVPDGMTRPRANDFTERARPLISEEPQHYMRYEPNGGQFSAPSGIVAHISTRGLGWRSLTRCST